MIDVASENLVPLTKAKIPGSPSIVTLWRWRLKGVRGVRLETATVGGRVFTSTEAVARFIEGTTAAAQGQPAPLRTPAQRERDIRRAEKELAEMGI